MSDAVIQNRNKSVPDRGSHVLDEGHDLVCLAMSPVRPGDNRKSALARAAERLGLTYSKARKLFYRLPCRLYADELDRMRRRSERAVEMARRVEADLETLDTLWGPDVSHTDD